MRRERLVPLISAMLVLAACSGEDGETKGSNEPKPGSVGAPCIEDDEWNDAFNGFAVSEINIATLSTRCDSQMCIANHFQGRVSCPYGQTEAQTMNDPRCFVPESDAPITVIVNPQRIDRPAAKTVTCSCRCAGPVGPFCECPSGTVCDDLVEDFGAPRPMPPMYCVPIGAVYDSTLPIQPEFCDATALNCGDPRPYPPP